VLVSGLPPESATWRHDQLPPDEQLLQEIVSQVSEWGRASVKALLAKPGERLQMPPPPRVLLAPGEEDPKPANVVSIAEFAAMNPTRAKKTA
jgi:hypothetical protein